jgi:hypothetical protein
VPNCTVSKASYVYNLQARKNFSDAPKMRHANLTENTNGQLDRGMNRAGLAVTRWISVKVAASPDKTNTKGGEDDFISSQRVRVLIRRLCRRLPPAIDIGEYDAVVIWCEVFIQFITAARLEN